MINYHNCIVCQHQMIFLLKNPMTSAGIEPATFQFVAQHLNHCATVVPLIQAVPV